MLVLIRDCISDHPRRLGVVGLLMVRAQKGLELNFGVFCITYCTTEIYKLSGNEILDIFSSYFSDLDPYTRKAAIFRPQQEALQGNQNEEGLAFAESSSFFLIS